MVYAFSVFERIFKEYGLPKAIRTDNGVPFSSPKSFTVTYCERICFKTHKIHLSIAFAGQEVGIKEVRDGIWLVSFMDYDLGYFDEESELFESLNYPFVPENV